MDTSYRARTASPAAGARDAQPGRATSRWGFPLAVAVLLATWTLLCAGAWLLVDASGALLDAGSGWLAPWPEVLWWAQWTVRLLEATGAWLVALVWTFGAVGVVVGAWVGRRLWRAARGAAAGLDRGMPVSRLVVPGEGVAAAQAAAAAHPALPDGRRPAND